jgi:ankyrin repeat protein
VQCDLKKRWYQCEKNPKNDDHFTPLHMAAMNGHLQTCNLIIKNICNRYTRSGKPKNPESPDRTTPLHIAALNGHLQV